MKKILIAAATVALMSAPAFAQTTCKAGAKGSDGKPLAGAAMTSHMKKCEADAKKSCEDKATAAKLSGAAKTSNVNKCVKDAVG